MCGASSRAGRLPSSGMLMTTAEDDVVPEGWVSRAFRYVVQVGGIVITDSECDRDAFIA